VRELKSIDYKSEKDQNAV